MSAPQSGIDAGGRDLMRAYVEKTCGIQIGEQKEYLLESRLSGIMAKHGCSSLAQLYFKAAHEKDLVIRDEIIDAITTQETFWFRDTSPFAVLAEEILPLKAQQAAQHEEKAIRIWSAACSSGQEPYSIAITVLEQSMRPRGLRAGNVAIVATDVSARALVTARAGRYHAQSIARGLSEKIRDRYFARHGDDWVLDTSVTRMVRFERHNLLDDAAKLGHQDIIFCRNVLIYFSDTVKKQLLERLGRLLRPDGCLLVGASESVSNYTNIFETVRSRSGVYYRLR